jgi:isopropylmalate/homocitrate/citramalate synthase
MVLRFNKHRRTLEQDEYRYELQDVDEPNLFRDIFSYDEVPKVPFNHRLVPMNPAEEIWITDTTFRDGQQGFGNFTVEQIVDLYKLMSELSGPNGVIRQSEFFIYTEKDRKAVEKCMELGLKYPEITSWIRANEKDFELVKQMGIKETGILASVSDYHIFFKLKMKRSQAMAQYLKIVEKALEMGIIPRVHFEDITRTDFYGFVVPFARQLMKLAHEAKMPVKIRACDTLGYGVTYPGASLPRSVPGIIYGLTRLAGVPSEWLEWHGHNDFYFGVVNATTAWLYGCSAANGSLLGIGERTGNTPIEALCIHYVALRGETNGMDLSAITRIAEYFKEKIGYRIPPNQPFVGENFAKTRAGIHADGLLKYEEIYNIFNTEKILGRKPEVGISDKSGLAGIAYWVNIKLKIPENEWLPKEHPGILKIKEWIDEQYNVHYRVSDISDEEMWDLVKTYLPEVYNKYSKDK